MPFLSCDTLTSIVCCGGRVVLTLWIYSFLIDHDDTLRLQLKDMDLEFSWSVEKIKEALRDRGSCTPSSPTSCSSETIKILAALVEEQYIPEAKIGLAAGVTAFLWLYTSIQGYDQYKCLLITFSYCYLEF